MREKLYTIFYLGRSEKLGCFCSTLFMVCFLLMLISGGKLPNVLIFALLSPTLFFTSWLILALIVLGIEKLIIAPIEFVVYKLGIPKIKINVDVIWKYQQKD